MIQNPVESVGALGKLADIIGKKTLVMWCIVTTFTTGYLFIDGRNTTNARINEQKAAYERMLEEVKGIKEIQKNNTEELNSRLPRLDTAIDNAQKTLRKLKR